jgi:hypothetical protein
LSGLGWTPLTERTLKLSRHSTRTTQSTIQVAEEPVEGREAIREMFANGFARTEMVCIIENVFEDGEWAILEWRDPKGLRGCGFFHVVNSKIVFQRGYWDKLSFLKLHDLPAPKVPA